MVAATRLNELGLVGGSILDCRVMSNQLNFEYRP